MAIYCHSRARSIPPPKFFGQASTLLTTGPYSIVRHPRYLAALVGITGFALIVNYPALYLMLAASFPVGWLMVALEER